MNNVNLKKLADQAGEMALDNIWGRNAYKINMEILKLDDNNCAACTRLAKYYKINDNITKAKNMYLKALDIDPNNRGAINNLNDIEKDQLETAAIDQIKTTRELLKEGQAAMLKAKYNLAAKYFAKAYSVEPLLTHAVSLATAYKQMDRYDKIEKLYKKLTEDDCIQADLETIDNEFNMLRLNEKSLTK